MNLNDLITLAEKTTRPWWKYVDDPEFGNQLVSESTDLLTPSDTEFIAACSPELLKAMAEALLAAKAGMYGIRQALVDSEVSEKKIEAYDNARSAIERVEKLLTEATP